MTSSHTYPATRPPRSADRSATRTAVTVLGLLAALNGVDHGVGAISQGRGAPPGLVYESWAHVDAFDPLNGEPALTVIPDLLVSGLATLVVAVALGVWVTSWPVSRHSGAVVLGLAGLLLLVGGGFGPPLLGVVVGVLAMRARSPATRPAGPATRLVARLWPWPLVVAAACFLGLVPGTAVLYVAGVDSDALVSALTAGAFTATGLTAWSALARDRAVATPGSSPTSAHQSSDKKEAQP